MLTSKMYRCTGRQWQEWGWGPAGNGFQYTALLRDSAAEQHPLPAAETDRKLGEQDADEENDLDNRQTAGRGRRKSCRQG